MAGVEGNCYWLGHTDGAEGAFSLFQFVCLGLGGRPG